MSKMNLLQILCNDYPAHANIQAKDIWGHIIIRLTAFVLLMILLFTIGMINHKAGILACAILGLYFMIIDPEKRISPIFIVFALAAIAFGKI